MEYRENGETDRTLADTIKTNGLLMSLDEVGLDTSIYAIHLLPLVDGKQLYIQTKDGKIYEGGVRCIATGSKDKVLPGSVRLAISTDSSGNKVAFQFLAVLGNECVDARGSYCRTKLTIIRKTR